MIRDAKSVSIGDILGPNTRERVIVPAFQRGYEWNKKHVEAFWRDLIQFQTEANASKDAPNGKRERYFLGPIVTLEKRDQTELLDGQQRLATATILLAVLRDESALLGTSEATDFSRLIDSQYIKKGEDGEFSLTLGETDKAYFRDTIQSPVTPPPKPKLRTHRNIKDAKLLLTERVNKQIKGDNPRAALALLRQLRSTVIIDLILAAIPVDSEGDAFRIFETLNDRGLRLSVPDLLLNFLMRNGKNEEEQRRIRQLWTGMIDAMGRKDINRFVRHLWVSKYGDLKNKDLFTAIRDKIDPPHPEDPKEKRPAPVSSLDFAAVAAEECDRYVELINFDPGALGPTGARLVKSLINDLGSMASLPLLLSAYKKLKPAEFEKVCRYLLVFVVRHSIVSNLDSAHFETIAYDLAKQIRAMPDDSPSTVRKTVMTIKETMVSAAPGKDRFTTDFAKLILTAEEARYIVRRLATHEETETRELGLGHSETNLEHIFPRSPKAKEWGGKSNHEKLEQYLWHVGNLTMLGERLNQEASNAEFSVKKDKHYANSELAMVKKLAGYSAWDETTIVKRAESLAEAANEIWNFDNPSRV